MATTQPISGVSEYTTTTGTGDLVLTGAVDGYLGLTADNDGEIHNWSIFVQGSLFEVFNGAYTHSTRTVARTTTIINQNGTSSAQTLPAGTKIVSIVPPGERICMLDVEGRRTAVYHMKGYRLYLDSDEDTWMDSTTDDTIKMYCGSAQVLQVNGGAGGLTIFGNLDTAAAGPSLVVLRQSVTPADNDFGPDFQQQMKDAGGTVVTTFRLLSQFVSAAAGAATSRVYLQVLDNGAVESVMQFFANLVNIPATVNFYTVGKTSVSTTTAGAEMRNDGSVVGVADGAAAMQCHRLSSDGDLMYFGQAGNVEGTVSVSGATVTYGTFTGGHWSEWASDPGAGLEQPGTVVSTADGFIEDGMDKLPFVRPAAAGDRNVYGVVAGRHLTRIGRHETAAERALLMIHGLGLGVIRTIGPVVKGDLLCVSATPGVAEVQSDDIVRSTTVAKATQDSPDTGSERLVPCVLMAG
jgi:hypothetical protein